MSAAMDRALMTLSLEEEEEEVPFLMPNLPGFSSAEENALSLIGRTLNPEQQRMSGLILTMPRKWQKEGRVRGIALSDEKFQFIFQTEHDLRDVLEKGVSTYADWPLVVERWMENPPEDYLQYIPLWVQISKIPVNYYTHSALMSLAGLLGKVKILAFDPSKPITQPFIRAQIRFNVANPLKMARVLDMGGGKTHTIHFDYERIQKRCFTCRRINHEKTLCPLEVRKRQDAAQQRREKIINEKNKAVVVLQQDDPLFGVLAEEQVGPDPMTGRPKIAAEVLEEMRRFLLADTGEALALKIDKVQKSVQEVEKDPIAKNTVLRLEAPPLFTTDLNKGKGPVFDYGEKEVERRNWDLNIAPNKLMEASMKALRKQPALSAPMPSIGPSAFGYDGEMTAILSDCSTVFRAGASELGSSGTVRRKAAVRRRPPRAQRQRNRLAVNVMEREQDSGRREGKQEQGSRKRKKTGQEAEKDSNYKAQCLKVIPHEGSPSSQ